MDDPDTALAFALRADEHHASGDADAASLNAREALSRHDDTSLEAHPRAETCLGLLSWAAGEAQRCREHFERAANLRKAWRDGPVHSLIGALDNLALILDRTGAQSSALDLRWEALSLAETRTPHDLATLRRLRRRLGQSIADAGDHRRALELYMGSRPAPDDSLQDKIGWANALALLAERRGDWTEAGRWYEAAVGYVEDCGPGAPGIAHAVGNAAIAWIDLGAYGRAAPLLRLLRDTAKFDHTLATRQSLLDLRAHALARRGRFLGALRLQEAAENLATAAGFADTDDAFVRTAHRVELLRKIGRAEDAQSLADATLAKSPTSSDALLPILVAAAELRIRSADAQYAIALLSRALTSALRQPDPAPKSRVFAALADASGAAGRNRAAILLGKIGIEYVRRSGSTVGPTELEDWLAPRLEAYERTLDRLTLASRLPEALRLQIHRLREVVESVARSGDAGGASLRDPVPYRTGEQDMRARLTALELELRTCFTAEGEPSLPNGAAVDGVTTWLNDVLEERFDPPAAARPTDDGPTPPAGTGVISFFPAGGGYQGALRTAEGLISFAVPSTAEDLAQSIRALRHACVEETDAWRTPANALHAALIAPAGEALSRLTRLDVLSAGAVSFVPFAALHDGNRFLVERTTITMRTGYPPQPGVAAPRSSWRAVAFGRGLRGAGLGALHGTLREIERLSEHLPIDVYLDENFTAESLRRELAKAPDLVHIATHFTYEPGRPHASTLSLGSDERLALSIVAGKDYSFAGVELLVLACCDTAVTDSLDLGLESLAGLAQAKGAAAVVASAWPVADISTERLMASFYRHLFGKGRDVAAALTEAQLEVCRGCVFGAGPSRGGGIGSGQGRDNQGHPGSWAGFSAYMPSFS